MSNDKLKINQEELLGPASLKGLTGKMQTNTMRKNKATLGPTKWKQKYPKYDINKF